MDDFDDNLTWSFTCHNCEIDFDNNSQRKQHERDYPYHFTTADQS